MLPGEVRAGGLMRSHVSYHAHDLAGGLPPRLAWACLALLIGAAGASTGAKIDQAASSTAPAYSSTHSIATDMQPIMALLNNRDKITYTVILLRHGARTITTSKDPAVASLIRTHAWEMAARMEQGANIRPADPLFQELFRHHSEIKIRLRNIPGGVLEDETSANPQVALLIKAHTQAVREFLRYGIVRAKRPTALPEGYHAGPGDLPSKTK